jgi:hypothetical protein
VATSKLLLYNRAIILLGERQLSSITENREPKRVLDMVWDTGAVDFVLEQGLWNFAMRTAEIEYSPSVTPSFGYSRAFDKPEDWIRTAALCSDEFFREPLNEYSDEAGYWFAELDRIYVRFVSNGSTYGNDLSLWPQSFVQYVAAYLATEAARRITQYQSKVDDLELKSRELLKDARSRDAMSEPTAFPPQGSWTRARQGGRGRRRDGGGRGGLIG